MHIIKLSAIDSTNSYLKKLLSKSNLKDYTIVVAENQHNGRGQMGTVWDSGPSKNLTVSILKCFDEFEIQNQFYLSMAVALSVLNTIKKFAPNNIAIKWPNDILADKNKISGILIENILKGRFIKQSVVGIGLNVNQVEFPQEIATATSLKRLTGNEFDKNEILENLIFNIKYFMNFVENKKFEALKELYLKDLFKFKEPAMFEDKDGAIFMGKICDVANDGRLVVELENEKTRKFNLKEIKFASL